MVDRESLKDAGIRLRAHAQVAHDKARAAVERLKYVQSETSETVEARRALEEFLETASELLMDPEIGV